MYLSPSERSAKLSPSIWISSSNFRVGRFIAASRGLVARGGRHARVSPQLATQLGPQRARLSVYSLLRTVLGVGEVFLPEQRLPFLLLPTPRASHKLLSFVLPPMRVWIARDMPRDNRAV